ncbi:dienelactone hydrolase family protein [Chengkuizengella axinellae]|uniref:Acetylxylan esterase n=1 Tax=Chengkuizengella axinellae TaxID=3064388 RepID=A0ABT9ITI1_9BACL|nr:acetylxylan esterase [Chengkuizengella sp. 2205SS18-9]MDP5272659.1 acetylxylan esterase [Chengkuizengella sp. 2205SS18-9]
MKDSLTEYLIAASGERKVPDTLYTQKGEKVTAAEQWEQVRRPEVLALFREHVYGVNPVERPDSLSFNIVETKEGMMGGKATRKQVDISFEGPGGKGTIRLLLFVPSKQKKPVPAFLLINKRGLDHMDPEREKRSGYWPAESIVERGYAAAVFWTNDVDPDEHDEFKNGVHGIFDDKERPSNAWGTIGAWAWGASRVMDYLEADSDIDADRVAVAGHSRTGKTALWAGAVDERFAFVISNDSGNTGAAISRGKIGETINQINTKFPHWFNENYKTYNDKEFDLPIDQHMLLSLIAPRSVYVASATEDEWADPKSEFLSLVYATPVYQLYGFNGLGTNQFPQPESPIIGDKMGHHIRIGKHNLTQYDWEQFINFWDQIDK